MIEIGKYNELAILRETSVGLYLGDDSGESVLLPNKYCPESYELEDKISVFVYLDSEERKIATNITPKVLLNEFALLQVSAIAGVGAFMDWGLEKDLMVPFREQRQKMEKGRWYIVYLDIDKKTNRLYASNKVEKFLQNEQLTVKEGDGVEVMVLHQSDLGFSVIVNNAHKGLVFENEIFQKLNIGDKLRGYVKKIRDDNKIDISLQPIGYRKFNDANSELIYKKLFENEGSLAITDKSSPDEIYKMFGISKKAFKKSIGALYKARKIEIGADGIKLLKEQEVIQEKEIVEKGKMKGSVEKVKKGVEKVEVKKKKEIVEKKKEIVEKKKEIVEKGEEKGSVEKVKKSEEKVEGGKKIDFRSHWETIYLANEDSKTLGWYEEIPEPSLRLISKCNLGKDAVLLNIGAGTGTLIDELVKQGYENIIVNDISSTALEKLKKRLGGSASKVRWILDDIIQPETLIGIKAVDLWHDRAVLHFFNEAKQQDAYFALLSKLVKPGGFVIIATFNLEGASHCSGLPVFRYNEKMLQQKLGSEFRLTEAFDYTYTMPSGDKREYVYTLFKRKDSTGLSSRPRG